MEYRGVFLLLLLLFLVGIHAQTMSSLPSGRFLNRLRIPRPPFGCPRRYCTSDNPACSRRPGIFMPCVTYSHSISVASCDCQLWIAGPGK